MVTAKQSRPKWEYGAMAYTPHPIDWVSHDGGIELPSFWVVEVTCTYAGSHRFAHPSGVPRYIVTIWVVLDDFYFGGSGYSALSGLSSIATITNLEFHSVYRDLFSSDVAAFRYIDWVERSADQLVREVGLLETAIPRRLNRLGKATPWVGVAIPDAPPGRAGLALRDARKRLLEVIYDVDTILRVHRENYPKRHRIAVQELLNLKSKDQVQGIVDRALELEARRSRVRPAISR